MRKNDKQLLAVGLLGAATIGGIAYFKPSVFSGIFAKGPQVVSYSRNSVAPLRLFVTGIPKARYLLTASAAEGSTIPIMLVTNKPYVLSEYGSLNVDLPAPTPSVVTIIWQELKSGRKIKNVVPITATQQQQSVTSEFRTVVGKML